MSLWFVGDLTQMLIQARLKKFDCIMGNTTRSKRGIYKYLVVVLLTPKTECGQVLGTTFI